MIHSEQEVQSLELCHYIPSATAIFFCPDLFLVKLVQNYLWYCFGKLLEFEYGNINCSTSAVSKLTLRSTSRHHCAVNASMVSAPCYI